MNHQDLVFVACRYPEYSRSPEKCSETRQMLAFHLWNGELCAVRAVALLVPMGTLYVCMQYRTVSVILFWLRNGIKSSWGWKSLQLGYRQIRPESRVFIPREASSSLAIDSHGTIGVEMGWNEKNLCRLLWISLFLKGGYVCVRNMCLSQSYSHERKRKKYYSLVW